jgi:2-polyprenyl-3-methyl-5-hydroxy-6-metoxy-1,4-benzoquinol methylase
MTSTAQSNPPHSADHRATQAIDNELRRLQAQEHAHDLRTIPLLEALPLPSDASCLEVGAGAGSIARWMCRNTAGPVLALDTDVTHLGGIPGLDVVQADIET